MPARSACFLPSAKSRLSANSIVFDRRPPATWAPPRVKASWTRSVTASLSDVDSALVPVDLEAHFVAHLAEHGAARRDAELVAAGLAIVGAIVELEAADPELVLFVGVARELDAQHLVLVDGVLDAGVEVDAVGLRRHDAVERRAVDVGGADRLGVERVHAADVERERRLALLDRAVHRVLVAARLLGRLVGRERVARVERLVAERQAGVVAPLAVARAGADVDAREAGFVVLGRVGIEAEADLGDLRLRRQAAAREAVDPQHRAGAGHLLQLLGHLVFVVGQRVDLVRRQRRREVVADVLVGLVAGDFDLLDVAGDRAAGRRGSRAGRGGR